MLLHCHGRELLLQDIICFLFIYFQRYFYRIYLPFILLSNLWFPSKYFCVCVREEFYKSRSLSSFPPTCSILKLCRLPQIRIYMLLGIRARSGLLIGTSMPLLLSSYCYFLLSLVLKLLRKSLVFNFGNLLFACSLFFDRLFHCSYFISLQFSTLISIPLLLLPSRTCADLIASPLLLSKRTR